MTTPRICNNGEHNIKLLDIHQGKDRVHILTDCIKCYSVGETRDVMLTQIWQWLQEQEQA